jgi:CubicO group peptidase (beta-lactamase class C family)
MAMTAAIGAGEYGNVHAVLIERDGKLVYEQYFDGEDRSWGAQLGRVRFGRASLHDLRSITKSVTSTLIGIAIDRGEIPSVDVPLYELLPRYAHLLTGEKRTIRLRHVLSMSAGLEWNEWSVPYDDPQNDEARLYGSSDPIAFALSRMLIADPGRSHNYSGGLTQVLAAVLEQATGRDIVDYAREVLFRPLFVYDMVWRTEDGSTPVAAYGLRMRARDLAKLGSVFLNRGIWAGRRIVSETWVKEALRSHLSVDQLAYRPSITTHVGYGYQWWHLRYLVPGGIVEAPSAVGLGNQRIILIPELQLSVTMFAGEYDSEDPTVPWLPDQLMVDHVFPAVQAPDARWR